MYLKLLERGVRTGVINLHLPNGKSHRFGSEGIEAHWHVKSEGVIRKIARDWEWQLGETYINGEWDIADCELRDLLFVLRTNFATYRVSKLIQPLVKILQQWNQVSRSYDNVAHHYDLEEDFFRLFLDEDLHYSCAYFLHDDYSLEQAQREKSRHIARKMLIEPGQTILDIGCGWGSLGCYLAQLGDVEVVGITLSKEQLAVARRRAKERGIKNIRFELQDYREHRGSYDRIVSVGMFEHVGTPYHNAYFQSLQSMLSKNGIALVHSVGRSGPPGVTNPWIRKYIFPGGSIPALSEMTQAVEHATLLLTDVEVLRLHYAKTLRAWQIRFQQHRELIRAQKGERFCRMWEFYLTICEVSFQCSDLVVFQLQIAQQHGVVPTTRDYQYTGHQPITELQCDWSVKNSLAAAQRGCSSSEYLGARVAKEP
jgi:cyclopropane-fatty-acyl-phospholipid synthase